jgi:hypothetical protein
MSSPERIGGHLEVSKQEILASLQTVLQSRAFSHSPSLRQTLEFVVRCSLSSSPEPIKEYSIATEVLGRTKDFDPKSDNIVRVQMHRLREKLEEYYSSEGRTVSPRIFIPRGQYSPEYTKHIIDYQPDSITQQPVVSDAPRKKIPVNWGWRLALISFTCNLIVVATYFASLKRLPSPLRPIWGAFLRKDTPPLIVYANPAFMVSTRGNFYLYDPPTNLSMPMGSRVQSLGNEDTQAGGTDEKGPFFYFDSYTGSGELAAAARIAQFLTSYGQTFLIKRSRIVSYEDVKNQNVIFLGGTGQNLILRNLPIPQELVFQSAPADEVPMGSSIRDLNPSPGHPASYSLQLNPTTGAIQVEYGLVDLLPGVSAGHVVLVLGGITTLGTQAAADFVTSERNLALLEQMRAALTPSISRSAYLQAVLRVEVRDGVPLEVKCILVRDLNQASH